MHSKKGSNMFSNVQNSFQDQQSKILNHFQQADEVLHNASILKEVNSDLSFQKDQTMLQSFRISRDKTFLETNQSPKEVKLNRQNIENQQNKENSYVSERKIEQKFVVLDLQFLLQSFQDLNAAHEKQQKNNQDIKDLQKELAKYKNSLGSTFLETRFQTESERIYPLVLKHIETLQEVIESQFIFLSDQAKLEDQLSFSEDDRVPEISVYVTQAKQTISEYEHIERKLKFQQLHEESEEKQQATLEKIATLQNQLQKFSKNISFYLKQQIVIQEKSVTSQIKENKSLLSQFMSFQTRYEKDIKHYKKMLHFKNESLHFLGQKLEQKLDYSENEYTNAKIYFEQIILKEIRHSKMQIFDLYESQQNSLFTNITLKVFKDTKKGLNQLKHVVLGYTDEINWVQNNITSIREQILQFIARNHELSQKVESLMKKEIQGSLLSDLQNRLYETNQLLVDVLSFQQELKDKCESTSVLIKNVLEGEIKKLAILVLSIENCQKQGCQCIENNMDVFNNYNFKYTVTRNQSIVEQRIHNFLEQFAKLQKFELNEILLIKQILQLDKEKIQQLNNQEKSQKWLEYWDIINYLLFIFESISYLNKSNMDNLHELEFITMLDEIYLEIQQKNQKKQEQTQIVPKEINDLIKTFIVLVTGVLWVTSQVQMADFQNYNPLDSLYTKIYLKKIKDLGPFEYLYEGFSQQVLSFLQTALKEIRP